MKNDETTEKSCDAVQGLGQLPALTPDFTRAYSSRLQPNGIPTSASGKHFIMLIIQLAFDFSTVARMSVGEHEKTSSLGHGPGSVWVGRHCPIFYFQQMEVIT